jgi:hypothetical protein
MDAEAELVQAYRALIASEIEGSKGSSVCVWVLPMRRSFLAAAAAAHGQGQEQCGEAQSEGLPHDLSRAGDWEISPNGVCNCCAVC